MVKWECTIAQLNLVDGNGSLHLLAWNARLAIAANSQPHVIKPVTDCYHAHRLIDSTVSCGWHVMIVRNYF